MREEYRVAQLQLQYPQDKELLAAFLAKNQLAYEADIQAAFGVIDEHETLVACGCAAGSLLKCFAVEPGLRGQNILGPLVSALVQDRFAAGLYELFIITRAKNEVMFSNCGFFPVVRTEQLVLLENRPNGPQVFTAPMRQPEDEGKIAGAIVMNCNPFTLGHRALAEYAASHCDILHLFVVEEDRSDFPTDVRLRLVREGTAHLPNVRVHLSGHYMISSATFPTYFLKAGEDAAVLQSELDVTLFAQCICTRSFFMDDADYVLISFGCSVRSALGAMEIGRAQGLNIGVLQLVTVWPFPDELISQVCSKAKAVFVPEMNQGMIVREVQRVNHCGTPVFGVNRIDAEMITPTEILDAIRREMK